MMDHSFFFERKVGCLQISYIMTQVMSVIKSLKKKLKDPNPCEIEEKEGKSV